MPRLRYSITPGDGPAEVAARRMGLSETAFREALPALRRRGFPEPDPTTGLFDLQAIDEWRRRRHPQLWPGPGGTAADARMVARDRIARLSDGVT